MSGKKIREAAVLFIIQIFNYGLLCVNYRAVAQTEYHLSALTDFLLATMSFFIIRNIAKSEDAMHQWLGYTLGGVAGSYTGIYISTLLH
jgi:hypothetical protein